MATSPYSGILGSAKNPLGKFVLGAVTTVTNVTDSVTVIDSNSFEVDQGPTKRMNQPVTVTQTITAISDRPITITDNISVTPTVTPSPQPYTHLTQFVTEVLYVMTPTARITQFVVEVVYKKAKAETVTHSITVTPTLMTQFRDVHESVSHAITVTPTITERDNINRQSVTSSITVTPALTEHDPFNHQTVTSSITVTPTIGLPDRNVRQTITTNVSITPGITERNTILRETVVSNISLTPVVSMTGTQITVEITVIDNISVTSTPIGRNTNIRITVTTSIAVSGPGAEGVSNHEFVTDDIAVGSALSERNTNDRITVADTITVTDTASGRNNMVRLTVADSIQIPQNWQSAWPATARDTNNRITYTDAITVTPAILGGPTPRRISYTEHVKVGQNVRTGWQFQTVSDLITVSAEIGGIGRALTITDQITVTDSFTYRDTVIRQTVSDAILVTTTRTGVGPIVQASTSDNIIVYFVLSSRVVPRTQAMVDSIVVTPKIIIGGVRNITVTDTVKVTDSFRNANNKQSVTDNISVTTRFPALWLTVHDRISVSQKAYTVNNVSITDTLEFTESVTPNTNRRRGIVQQLPMVDTVQRGIIWNRSIVDTLILPDKDFQRQFSFWPYPFTVPVVSGGLMANLVVMTCQGDSITLPAAILGDSQGGTDKITVQRSMNAKTMTIVQSNDRRKLKLSFRVSLKKSIELRKFVMSNIAGLIQLTDWNGTQWVGRFMGNPFTLEHAGRSVTEQEFVTFEIDFEGAKLSG